ncbi:MAG: S26 family signal peptidase, partial [Thermoanaerobaculia bacterium]
MDAHAAPSELTRGARRAARAALLAVLAALFCRAFVLEIRVVAGASMSPALLPGDRVLVDRLIYARPARQLGRCSVRVHRVRVRNPAAVRARPASLS